MKKADLPYHHFHDLRHTNATLMLDGGIHPKIASERLGHANVSVTLDTYSHALPDMQREASDLLDDIITGQNGRGSKRKPDSSAQ